MAHVLTIQQANHPQGSVARRRLKGTPLTECPPTHLRFIPSKPPLAKSSSRLLLMRLSNTFVKHDFDDSDRIDFVY
jgi:hypothetical protein